jgi:hypothetical protein
MGPKGAVALSKRRNGLGNRRLLALDEFQVQAKPMRERGRDWFVKGVVFGAAGADS